MSSLSDFSNFDDYFNAERHPFEDEMSFCDRKIRENKRLIEENNKELEKRNNVHGFYTKYAELENTAVVIKDKIKSSTSKDEINQLHNECLKNVRAQQQRLLSDNFKLIEGSGEEDWLINSGIRIETWKKIDQHMYNIRLETIDLEMELDSLDKLIP